MVRTGRVFLPVIIAFAYACATVGDLVISSPTMIPTDSVQCSWSSDQDSTVLRLYLETGDPAGGLDTTTDPLWYTVYMVDNSTDAQMGDDTGLFPDADPATGMFLFSPGENNLAPGTYHIVVTDDANSVSTQFEVVSFSNPFRTVSGTVYPPTGEDPQWIEVWVHSEQTDQDFSAYTGADGTYSIGLPQDMVEGSTEMTVGLEDEFTGYLVSPSHHKIDVSAADQTGLDFNYVDATAEINGTVVDVNGPVSGIRVGLVDTTTWEGLTEATTDAAGMFTIPTVGGEYGLMVDVYDMRHTYMAVEPVILSIADNQTRTRDISLFNTDAQIYGRITVEGTPTGDIYSIEAVSESAGRNWDTCTADGWFAIPVSSLARSYEVFPGSWDQYATLPEGYYIEGSEGSLVAAPGDTVLINLLPEPTGGISGAFFNSTSMTHSEFMVRLWADGDSTDHFFSTPHEGSYEFTGIPDGTYNVEGGMSVAGDPSGDWKIYKPFTDIDGTPAQITIAGSIMTNVSFEFFDEDTMINDPGTGGGNRLEVALNNYSMYMPEGYEISLWKNVPDPYSNSQAAYVFYAEDTASIHVVDIPEDDLFYVAGRMKTGLVAGIQQPDLWKVATDESGGALMVDFGTTDFAQVSLEFQNSDTLSNTMDTAGATMTVSFHNQSSYQAQAWEVTFWEMLPGSDNQGSPVYSMWVSDSVQPAQVYGIPRKYLAVSARMISEPTGDEPSPELHVVLSDETGNSAWFDFAYETPHGDFTFTDDDVVDPMYQDPYQRDGMLTVEFVNSTNWVGMGYEVFLYSTPPSKTDTGTVVGRYWFDDSVRTITITDIPRADLFVEGRMRGTKENMESEFGLCLTDSTGVPIRFDFVNDTHSLVLEFTDEHMREHQDPGASGDGVVLASFVNSTSYETEGYVVELWDHEPSENDTTGPSWERYVKDTVSVFELVGVPEGSYMVTAYLHTVHDESRPYAEGKVIVTDSTDTPIWFTFAGADTHSVHVEFFEEDLWTDEPHDDYPMGDGMVSGTVQYEGALGGYPIYTMLFDLNAEEPIRFTEVDSVGGFVFKDIPAGSFRVMALIDTNQDERTEAFGFSDSTVAIVDSEHVDGIVVVVEDQQFGTGSISGEISSLVEMPANGTIMIMAVPIDTTQPMDTWMNEFSVMRASKTSLAQPGMYQIDQLADGMYAVLGVLVAEDTSETQSEIQAEEEEDRGPIAIGVYGTISTDTTLEVPFMPTPIAVVDGQAVQGINLQLMTEEQVSAVHAFRRKDMPTVFSLSGPVYSRNLGVVALRFGVPESRRVSIDIIDPAGRRVAVLHDDHKRPGFHTIHWDTRGQNGSQTAAGFFVCRMQAGEFRAFVPVRILH